MDEATSQDQSVGGPPDQPASSSSGGASSGGQSSGGLSSGGTDPTVAAVFRAFFVGDRLQTMPVKRSKRLIVLDHLARAFEPGIRYPESEVNAILQAFHPDFAMLRRYLVDEQFLSRDHGIYWRIGGSVDI